MHLETFMFTVLSNVQHLSVQFGSITCTIDCSHFSLATSRHFLYCVTNPCKIMIDPCAQFIQSGTTKLLHSSQRIMKTSILFDYLFFSCARTSACVRIHACTCMNECVSVSPLLCVWVFLMRVCKMRQRIKCLLTKL